MRALFFLYAIYRFHLPPRLSRTGKTLIPFDGYANLLKRRFRGGHHYLLQTQAAAGELSDGIANAVHSSLGFQTLADQVRRSVRWRQPVDVPHRSPG